MKRSETVANHLSNLTAHPKAYQKYANTKNMIHAAQLDKRSKVSSILHTKPVHEASKKMLPFVPDFDLGAPAIKGNNNKSTTSHVANLREKEAINSLAAPFSNYL